MTSHYGSFTLPETNSGTDSDSDSISMATLHCILITRHVHIAQTLTQIPTLFLHGTGSRVSVRTRFRLQQCK